MKNQIWLGSRTTTKQSAAARLLLESTVPRQQRAARGKEQWQEERAAKARLEWSVVLAYPGLGISKKGEEIARQQNGGHVEEGE